MRGVRRRAEVYIVAVQLIWRSKVVAPGSGLCVMRDTRPSALLSCVPFPDAATLAEPARADDVGDGIRERIHESVCPGRRCGRHEQLAASAAADTRRARAMSEAQQCEEIKSGGQGRLLHTLTDARRPQRMAVTRFYGGEDPRFPVGSVQQQLSYRRVRLPGQESARKGRTLCGCAGEHKLGPV